MKTIVIKTQEAEAKNKGFVLFDIEKRNAEFKYTFSHKLRHKAELMTEVLGSNLYSGKIHEPRFNKTGISIKVDGKVRDKKLLNEMEADWGSQGIIKKVSPQGTSYWIPKTAKV